MSARERDYQVIFSHLRSSYFHFLDDWVVQCVNYCKSTNPSLSLNAIKDIVKEQWLLVNLRNIKVPSLPPNLIECHKTVLPGKYMVQVEEMIDCSRSCYSQFQNIQKINVDNIEATKETKDWDIKSSRCLTFTISDGVQELQAMEYKPIKKIRTNDPELLPGFKMLIIGPVECRKGMIMLREENVEIHGGEVDTLTTTNKLRNLLMRKLNLNEEDYPEVATCTLLREENSTQENRLNEESDISSMPDHKEKNLKSVETLLSQNDELFLSLDSDILALESHSVAPQTIKNKVALPNRSENNATALSIVASTNIDHIDPDHVFDDILTTVLKKHSLPQEEKTTPSPKKLCERIESKNLNSSVKEMIPNLPSTSENKNIVPKISKEASNTPKTNLKESSGNGGSISIGSNKAFKSGHQTTLSAFFNSCNPPTSSTKTGNSVTKYPISISHDPFVYLKQIPIKNLVTPCVYTIKGTILTLKKKIAIENDEYSLVGTITDGSLSLDAKFSSDVIEKLLEYSPCEMREMMKIKNVNSAISDRIKEAFKKAQQNFISLNCLMKIKFFPNEVLPLILFLDEITQDHLKALIDRALTV